MQEASPQDTVHLVGFAEIGAYLRAERESIELHLIHPARELRLRSDYLQAIEDGRPEALPGLVYARGYTKQYTEYLGLDCGMVMQAFDQAVHFRDPVRPPGPTRREARPHRGLLLLCAVALLLLMGAWRLLWPAAGGESAQTLPAAMPSPRLSAARCWSHLPTELSGPACYSTPSPDPLRPSPRMRYGTELQLPRPSTDNPVE